mgnify:FL=1
MSDAGQETDVGVKRTHDELKSTSPHISTNPFNTNQEPLVDLAGSVGEVARRTGSIPGEGPNGHQNLELSDLTRSTRSQDHI